VKIADCISVHFNHETAKAYPASPCCLLPCSNSLCDCAPFDFCDCCQHSEYHLARRCAGVPCQFSPKIGSTLLRCPYVLSQHSRLQDIISNLPSLKVKLLTSLPF